MNADTGAVLTRADMEGESRGVALVAEGLSLIGADLNRPVSFSHFRHGETDGGDVYRRAPVE